MATAVPSSVALTLLPEHLQATASFLTRQGQQTLYLLRLVLPLPHFFVVVRFYFQIPVVRINCTIYVRWKFDPELAESSRLGNTWSKTLFSLMFPFSLSFVFPNVYLFPIVWCFHSRLQQLQNPNIDDKSAWLHWTFCNAVAPPSGDSGMGNEETEVPKEESSILHQRI